METKPVPTLPMGLVRTLVGPLCRLHTELWGLGASPPPPGKKSTHPPPQTRTQT